MTIFHCSFDSFKGFLFYFLFFFNSKGCLDIKPESDPLCGGPGKKRYSFNRQKGRCTSFVHHGCRESKNVFRTRSECQRECACNVSLSHGVWCGTHDPYKLRYYWERKSGLCRPFWYSGCRGNHNRFASIEYCQRVCVQEKR